MTAAGGDSLDAFGSESGGEPSGVAEGWAGAARRRWLVAVLLIPAIGLAGYSAWKFRPFSLNTAAASLTIESDPGGAEVLASDGRKGVTPLTLSIPPGEHVFELVHEGRRKPLRAVVRPGVAVVHHVQFAPHPSPVATTGGLRITTTPANLRVSVDGVARGVSPLLVEGLDAGAHTVQVAGASRLDRRVEVAAGETASVIIAAPVPTGPAAGWLTVSAPVELQILQGNEVLGTSRSAKVMLQAGKYDLQFRNEALGFSTRRSVQVTAGASAGVKVDLPNVPLSLNAVPWAEAWVDGVRVGETPIGNHPVRLGTHEIVFRHPDFGERRQLVLVTLAKAARVSVDMRKPKS